MYANFRELFYYTLGIDIPFLAVINTFGFFVALAFLVAATLLKKELQRKEAEGLLKPTTKKVIKGMPASIFDIATSALLGFVVGYKFLGMLIGIDWETQTPQSYMQSFDGSIILGLLLGGVFGFMTWRQGEKEKLPEPKEETVIVHPYQRVGNITVIAAVAGILGAKIFHHLENWGDFVRDPIGELSNFFGGLTFYGGLILAAACVIWYVRKHNIKPVHMFDATAPALIIAYGVGRIGCLVSGDGDWGVINSAYRIDEQREWHVVPPDSVTKELQNPNIYRLYVDSDGKEARSIYYEKPKALGFLPNWFFAYDFRYNVLNEGVPVKGCQRDHCSKLPIPVFPTALYEVIMASLIFGILWYLRKRLKIAGMLFCVYLMFNGIERFLIESIRVNTKMQFLGMTITQAQLISTCLFLVGAIGAVLLYMNRNRFKMN